MHEFVNNGFIKDKRLISRRDLLVAGISGAAGFAIGAATSSGKKPKMIQSSGGAKIEVLDASKYKQSFQPLGTYLYLAPEKLGGGTHVVDLESGRTLAWISYWNYSPLSSPLLSWFTIQRAAAAQ